MQLHSRLTDLHVLVWSDNKQLTKYGPQNKLEASLSTKEFKKRPLLTRKALRGSQHSGICILILSLSLSLCKSHLAQARLKFMWRSSSYRSCLTVILAPWNENEKSLPISKTFVTLITLDFLTSTKLLNCHSEVLLMVSWSLLSLLFLLRMNPENWGTHTYVIVGHSHTSPVKSDTKYPGLAYGFFPFLEKLGPVFS